MNNINSVGKSHCNVFTTTAVVKYMLDLSEYTSNRDLSQTKVIEPSCGEGEFVVEIIRRLFESSRRFNFDANVAINKMLTFYDTDQAKLAIAMGRAEEISANLTIDPAIFKCEDFLLASVTPVDLIVGNPPYIRHEQIDEKKKLRYRELYPTFRYRSDIYIPFFEKSLCTLAPNGKHCFICSNRWFKNQYGQHLRKFIAESFNLQYIIDLERVNPFQEEVIAYPAITVIERSRGAEQFKYLDVDHIEDLHRLDLKYEQRVSPKGCDWGDSFSRILIHPNLSTIEEMGFKIGIGVATGADKIFIGEDLSNHIEEELLLPILTSGDIKGTTINWGGKQLFNPFDTDGSMINLQLYPKALAYLLTHKDRLQSRHIAKRNPKSWYRTIDRIDHSLLSKPKILLADLSANSYIKVDDGHYYPHHNLYYITGRDSSYLALLSAILMSDFVISQLHSLSHKMSGGYPRWQSQYIRKLMLPNLLHIAPEDRAALLNSYRSNNIPEINTLVNTLVQN